MRRLFVLVLALGLSGCASFPPKTSDGKIDVQLLVEWAKDGLQPVCDWQPNSPTCTLGMQAIQIVASKGQDPAAVLAALTEAEDRWPVIKVYTHWLTALLSNVVHGTPVARVTGACNLDKQFQEQVRGQCSYICKPDFSTPSDAWAWTLVSGVDGCAAKL